MDFIFFADFGISAIAGIIMAAAAVASTAAGIAAQANQPKAPDQGAASAEASRVDAQLLPIRRAMEAAAQQGGKGSYTSNYAQFVKVPSGYDRNLVGKSLGDAFALGPGMFGKKEKTYEWVRYDPKDWQDGGKYWDLTKNGTVEPKLRLQKLKAPETQTVDFTGYGKADVQGTLAKQYADLMTDLSAKYGPQFAEEARKQLEQSDPEGFAARSKLDELIRQQANATPNRPVAELLDSQIQQELDAQNRLDPMTQEILKNSVAEAAASRGGQGDQWQQFADPLESGYAGQARREAGMQKAQSWLSSGATPEDVEYRRRQQTLSNLGSFISGQTPVAQFQNLSGAQQGTTPFVGGRTLPNVNQNAPATGNQFAMGSWNSQMQAQQQQANPWMAGLSGLLGLAGVAGSAGWQPFKTG